MNVKNLDDSNTLIAFHGILPKDNCLKAYKIKLEAKMEPNNQEKLVFK